MSDNPSKMSSPHRSSHSKRHASFNSPREVPLPSPALSLADSPFFLSPDHQDPQPANTIQPPRSPTIHATLRAQDERPMGAIQALAQEALLRAQKPSDGPSSGIAFPSSESAQAHSSPQVSATQCGPEPTRIRSLRPSALQQTRSATCSTELTTLLRQRQESVPVPDSLSTAWMDRYSSASLPLPSQIPFHTLSNQRTSNSRPTLTSSNSAIDRSPSPPLQIPANSPSPSPAAECPQLDSGNSSSSSSFSSSDGTSSVFTSSSSLNKEPSRDKQTTPPLKSEDSPIIRNEPCLPPPPRPISPFRAPQPPPSQPRGAPLLSEGTAMRRFMTASQLQSMSMSSTSSSFSMSSSSSSTMPQTMTDTSYPPPDPPIILPVESHSLISSQFDSRQAPYIPFLSHAHSSPDSSWIEVETAPSEYKLLVRLPGFSREGITLATKRRRILHIVADSWETGGGHFERKISFGYDADLTQVRAEFDGVMLRIAIPRRISPITWSGNMSRLGSSGRA